MNLRFKYLSDVPVLTKVICFCRRRFTLLVVPNIDVGACFVWMGWLCLRYPRLRSRSSWSTAVAFKFSIFLFLFHDHDAQRHSHNITLLNLFWKSGPCKRSKVCGLSCSVSSCSPFRTRYMSYMQRTSRTGPATLLSLQMLRNDSIHPPRLVRLFRLS